MISSGLLGARVVAGHHRQVGSLAHHLTHDGTLALVAVPAAAEDDDDAALGQGARRLQRPLQRVIGVRVVHQRHPAIFLDALHAPRDALYPLDAFLDVATAEPSPQRHPGRGQNVLQVVRPEQRGLDVDVAGRRFQRGFDAVEAKLHASGRDFSRPSAAEFPGHAPGVADLVVDAGGIGVIAIHHRHAARRKVVVEELPLGLEVGLHVRVVVEMVAREVGEAAGPEGEPVHALLVERVAGHLHHHRVRAGVEHLPEEAVQRQRVRGGVRGLLRPAGEAHVDGADAAHRRASGRADGFEEVGRRRLPVGAGDGEEHQLVGRPLKNIGRDFRQRASRPTAP